MLLSSACWWSRPSAALLLHPRRIRFIALAHNIEATGLNGDADEQAAPA